MDDQFCLPLEEPAEDFSFPPFEERHEPRRPFPSRTLFIIIGVCTAKILLWYFCSLAEEEGLDLSLL